MTFELFAYLQTPWLVWSQSRLASQRTL